MTDKRVAPRKIRRLPVVFYAGGEKFKGTSSDFSTSGIFIRTRKPLTPGTLIKIVLELEETRKINLSGVVARAIKTGVVDFKNGMGVRLESIPDEYLEFVATLE